ncbi:MAG: hypothetical protein JWR28_1893, partial [Modestobacter sp.]|nr:hypothetical protein [Modestobacter sp.]
PPQHSLRQRAPFSRIEGLNRRHRHRHPEPTGLEHTPNLGQGYDSFRSSRRRSVVAQGGEKRAVGALDVACSGADDPSPRPLVEQGDEAVVHVPQAVVPAPPLRPPRGDGCPAQDRTHERGTGRWRWPGCRAARPPRTGPRLGPRCAPLLDEGRPSQELRHDDVMPTEQVLGDGGDGDLAGQHPGLRRGGPASARGAAGRRPRPGRAPAGGRRRTAAPASTSRSRAVRSAAPVAARNVP